MKIKILLIISSLAISCKVIKNTKTDDDIICIKFIENFNTFSSPIDHETFWFFDNNHAKYTFNHKRFKKEIDQLEDIDYFPNDNLTYAFIVNNDTIYSCSDLKYFYLPKERKTKVLKNENLNSFFKNYSFFNKCW